MASYTVTSNNYLTNGSLSAKVGESVTINGSTKSGLGTYYYGIVKGVSVPGCTYTEMASGTSVYKLTGTVTKPGTYTFNTCAHAVNQYIKYDYTITLTVTGYTVSFNSNGGSSSPSAQYAAPNGTITLPSAGTKSGYTFDGWYTASSGGTRVGGSGSSYTVTANITLYAQWKEDAFTVTYNGNGGTSASASAKVNSGSSTTLPSASRIGYTLKGWYTASSGGTLAGVAGASYTPTASVTLYAQWDVLTSINVSGSWKPATPYVNVSGTWKEVVGVYVNVNGTWKKTK